MSITVEEGDEELVTYEIDKNEPVTLSASDFKTAYYNATGDTLSYVKFKLPSSSYGTLYYNYDDDDASYDSKVSASTKYYRSSTPYLSYITFVPYEDYTGTVTITYYGYNSNGDSVTCIMPL